MRPKVNRKSIASGVGAVGLLGLGLYLAVPAFADDPSPSPTASQTQDRDGRHPRDGRQHGRPGPHGHHGPNGRFGKQRPWKHRAHWAARGVHGESTVQGKDGKFRVTTWQRGQITAVSGASVTVRSTDGTSWTWTTNGESRIVKDKKKVATNALAAGDQIIVLGERSGATRTVNLIRVVPKR